MRGNVSRLLSLLFFALFFLANGITAYTCTFINKSHATITVEFIFFKEDFKDHSSPQATINPGETYSWEAGAFLFFPYLLSGFRIIDMTWRGRQVPGAAGFTENWGTTRHAANTTWEVTEYLPADQDGKTTTIQFIIVRKPAGVAGSTYPGGTIWTSQPMSLK